MAVRRIRKRGILFEFDDRDFDEIRKGSGVTSAAVRVAEQAAARARATAPVDTGEYRSSIHVEVSESSSRSRARVVADAPHAAAVESRTGNLRRALGG